MEISVFIKFNLILQAFIFFQKLHVCISFVIQFLNLKTYFQFCDWIPSLWNAFSNTCHFSSLLSQFPDGEGRKILLPRKLLDLASRSFACFVLKHRRQRSPSAYYQLENLRKEKVALCRIRYWHSWEMGTRHGCPSSSEVKDTVCTGENNLTSVLWSPGAHAAKKRKTNSGCRSTRGFWELVLVVAVIIVCVFTYSPQWLRGTIWNLLESIIERKEGGLCFVCYFTEPVHILISST